MRSMRHFLLIAFALVLPIRSFAQTHPATTATTTATAAADAAPLYRQAFTQMASLSDEDDQRLGLCGTDGCWVVKTPLDAGTAALLSRQAQTIALIRRA